MGSNAGLALGGFRGKWVCGAAYGIHVWEDGNPQKGECGQRVEEECLALDATFYMTPEILHDS